MQYRLSTGLNWFTWPEGGEGALAAYSNSVVLRRRTTRQPTGGTKASSSRPGYERVLPARRLPGIDELRVQLGHAGQPRPTDWVHRPDAQGRRVQHQHADAVGRRAGRHDPDDPGRRAVALRAELAADPQPDEQPATRSVPAVRVVYVHGRRGHGMAARPSRSLPHPLPAVANPPTGAAKNAPRSPPAWTPTSRWHGAGANLAFRDGSVKFVSENITLTTLSTCPRRPGPVPGLLGTPVQPGKPRRRILKTCCDERPPRCGVSRRSARHTGVPQHDRRGRNPEDATVFYAVLGVVALGVGETWWVNRHACLEFAEGPGWSRSTASRLIEVREFEKFLPDPERPGRRGPVSWCFTTWTG